MHYFNHSLPGQCFSLLLIWSIVHFYSEHKETVQISKNNCCKNYTVVITNWLTVTKYQFFFYIDFFFPLSTIRLLSDLFMSNTAGIFSNLHLITLKLLSTHHTWFNWQRNPCSHVLFISNLILSLEDLLFALIFHLLNQKIILHNFVPLFG